MITEKRKQTIKLIIAVSLLVLLFLFVVLKMIQYEVEGEVNMPFKLSKIRVMGTVEGLEEDVESKELNFDICQNNDVYFYIDRDETNAKEGELIKSVKISNIEITSAPQKGNIKTYMPNSEAGRLFAYNDQFLVGEKLEYKGASGSSYTNLEIGSKGGTALIRFSNIIENYTYTKKEEIIHNNTLLKKIETTNDQIKFAVSFDFIIETTETKYKSRISLDLPTGNLDEEEKCYLEKTDMSDVIFKRVN